MSKVLIIGGAGFIGSHSADLLHKNGYQIRILDNLSPKTHNGDWPKYLNPEFETILGDCRDKEILLKSLRDVDYVFHLAALMDLTPDFSNFIDTNATSTALLYELIVSSSFPIKKVVVASSQFVYGEGCWECQKDGVVTPNVRTPKQLGEGIFDPVCPICQGSITRLDNKESHQDPPNQYAISKYCSELISLKLGKQYNIPSVALRYSIVHGPRQSLKSVYSGALRIFTLKMLNNESPGIYEDGLQERDFISVYDVARANLMVLESSEADYQNFNVGGGKSYTILELAEMIKKYLNKDLDIKANGQFRVGDIRHAVSDISKLKKLGWKPEVTEEDTVRGYLDWVQTQDIDLENFQKIQSDLTTSGVVRG